MAKVVVAGGTGSLGTLLSVRLARDGHEVTVMGHPADRVNRELAQAPVRFRFADIRDATAVRDVLTGCDHAFNVAGIAVLSDRRHAEMAAVNVQGARVFAEQCSEAGVQRLVHVSSISAIGYPPASVVADEDFPYATSVASNSYSLTKRAGDEAVEAVAGRTGLDVRIVCPSAVVSTWSDLKEGWAALITMAARGKLRVAPPGGLSLCSQTAFVTGAVGAMDRDAPRHRYILSTQYLSYRDFFAMVNRIVGAPPPQMVVPPVVLAAIGAVGRGLTLGCVVPTLMAPENLDLMAAHLRYDAGRARADLDMDPGDVEASVTDVYRWLKEERLCP